MTRDGAAKVVATSVEDWAAPCGVLPPVAGAGYREAHAAAFAALGRPVAWVEIHAETYMVPGGPRLSRLLALRRCCPLSVHGVGLSLGGAEPLDQDHLRRLDHLCRLVEPALVSEHLAWSGVDGAYLNDLLPLPYTEETLALMADHVDQTQEALGRRILVENPSGYLALPGSLLAEPEFLAELARRTGCGLLVDVNNIHVSSRNLGIDAAAYVDCLPAAAIGEIHLAGHADLVLDDGEILAFDDHGSAVRAETWDLFRRLVARIGARPALVEWDNDLPTLDRLLAEVDRAQREMAAVVPRAPHVHP